MGHMPCGYVLTRRIAVTFLVIKKDVGTKCSKERAFLLATQKDRFINSDTPCPQGSNNPFMRRS